MTTTSALGTDNLPGRVGRPVLDERFDPQPPAVHAGDHPLLLELPAGRCCLQFATREPGTKIDRLFIAADPKEKPR